MIEILVGVNVVNADMYAAYRAEMTPLLEAHGGSFGIDVQVSEVLASPLDKPFNRLFTMRFPSEEQLEAFFAHPPYLAVRERLFRPSVSATSQFGRYQMLA